MNCRGRRHKTWGKKTETTQHKRSLNKMKNTEAATVTWIRYWVKKSRQTRIGEENEAAEIHPQGEVGTWSAFDTSFVRTPNRRDGNRESLCWLLARFSTERKGFYSHTVQRRDLKAEKDVRSLRKVYFFLGFWVVDWKTLLAVIRFSMYWPSTWFSDFNLRFSSFTLSTFCDKSTERRGPNAPQSWYIGKKWQFYSTVLMAELRPTNKQHIVRTDRQECFAVPVLEQWVALFPRLRPSCYLQPQTHWMHLEKWCTRLVNSWTYAARWTIDWLIDWSIDRSIDDLCNCRNHIAPRCGANFKPLSTCKTAPSFACSTNKLCVKRRSSET